MTYANLFLGTLVLISSTGCLVSTGDSEEVPTFPPGKELRAAPAQPKDQGSTPTAAPAPKGDKGGFDWGSTEAKIKFKDGADKTLYSIKYKPDGAKLVDGATPENELARYTIHELKLKIKDKDDAVLGYIVRSDDRYKIEGPDQKEALFKFIRQGDGDWKLEDGADKLIYKVKKRDYGYEIEDAAKGSLYKIKLKEGKTSLRDHQDKTVASTKEPISSLAAAALGLDEIKDVRIRAALAVAIEKSK
jgi:hypothetical protein